MLTDDDVVETGENVDVRYRNRETGRFITEEEVEFAKGYEKTGFDAGPQIRSKKTGQFISKRERVIGDDIGKMIRGVEPEAANFKTALDTLEGQRGETRKEWRKEFGRYIAQKERWMRGDDGGPPELY